MAFISSIILEGFMLTLLSVTWCELGYYYFLFNYDCSGWPGQTMNQNLTKILVLTDTHIMGPIKSVKLDKLRREWQMKQAFRISTSIYRPDLIIFLGDLFDEASYSPDHSFQEACEDFDRIFPHGEDAHERIIIPGNHDVGFHDNMIRSPYPLERFCNRYKATPIIELIKSVKLNDLSLVAINSMSFYNDTCPFCSTSIAATNHISEQVNRRRAKCLNECSAPILLTHIPLYRSNDTACDYPRSIKERVEEENIEGEDVVHETSSKFLLERLKPRLVLSGHTHMDCSTIHHSDSNEQIQEITISSYNHKYAQGRPSFLLLSANSTKFYTKLCYSVEEWIIIAIYVTVILKLLYSVAHHCANKQFGYQQR